MYQGTILSPGGINEYERFGYWNIESFTEERTMEEGEADG